MSEQPQETTQPDDRREEPPTPAASWVEEHEPAASESQRQTLETIRSVSRLEESNQPLPGEDAPRRA